MPRRAFPKGCTLTTAAVKVYRTTLLSAALSFGAVGLPDAFPVPTPTCPAVLLHEDLHQLAANICDRGVNGSRTGLPTTERAYTSAVQQYFTADTPWSEMPDPHRTIMQKLKDLRKKWKGTSDKKRMTDPAKWGKIHKVQFAGACNANGPNLHAAGPTVKFVPGRAHDILYGG